MNPQRWPECVFVELRSAGIPHCLLRDSLDPRDDLDLLIAPERFRDAIHRLQQIGFRVLRTSRTLPCKTVMVRCLEDGVAVLDLHAALIQNGRIYMDARPVLASVRWEGGLPRPAAPYLGAILLCHCVLGKGAIPDKHLGAIRKLNAGTAGKEWQEALRRHELAPLLTDAAENLDLLRQSPERLRDLGDQLRAMLDTWPAGFRRFRAKAYRALRPLLGPSAPLWAFLGPDGTGKSTLCRRLEHLVRDSGVARVRVVYMGPWGHYQLPIVSGAPFIPGWSLSGREWWRLMRRPNKEHGEEAGLRSRLAVLGRSILGRPLSARQKALRDRMRTSSRLFVTLRFLRTQVSAARFYMTLALETWYRQAKAWLARRRGILVLTDRYVYDLTTGGMHRTLAPHAGIRRLLCRLVPRPTRGFLLLNSPQAIQSRKNDLSAVELDRFLELYKDLARKYDFETIVTDRPPETLAWDLFRRYFDEIVDSVRW